MKIYISVDMEGMAGITSPIQEKDDREAFRRALHNQVSWIIEGIHRSSRNEEIEEITISDSHGSGTHLSYDELSAMDERISLVSGSPRMCYMMSGLDDTYDMVFLAGYHAGAGTAGASMDHCFFGRAIHGIRINGIGMNESAANAALAGEMGVPVGLVIGDSGLRRQLLDEGMMPWAEFVTTKDSILRYSACYRPQNRLKEETIRAVGKVLDAGAGTYRLYKVSVPCELQIDFNTSSMAEGVCQIPYTKRLGGRSVSVTCQDMKQAESAILALAMLGSAY